MLRCEEHPEYEGAEDPDENCLVCWTIWNTVSYYGLVESHTKFVDEVCDKLQAISDKIGENDAELLKKIKELLEGNGGDEGDWDSGFPFDHWKED